MKTQTLTHLKSSNRWQLVFALPFIAAALYLLAAHWHTVETSLRIARNAQLYWLLAAVVGMVGTILLAATIYGVLALRRLRYVQTVLVEVSAGFVNRILPSGLGSLGLHGVYLYRRKHTTAEATAVVSVNNLIGIAAHLLLLATLIIMRPHMLDGLHIKARHVTSFWWAGLLIIAGGLGVVLIPLLKRQVMKFLQNLLSSVRRIGAWRIFRALVLAMFLTTLYTLILWWSSRAVGVHLGILQTFVVFTAGMFSGTLVPLPGGLVGTEAGLLGGIVAFDVPATQAGAVVVIFRLVTYWLPIVPGVVALFFARRRKLV